MKDRTIKIVTGYLKNIDYPNATASELGLPNRFAVVLDTYRESKGYMYFDTELFFSLLQNILEEIPYDSMTIRLDTDGKRVVGSIRAFQDHLDNLPEEDREPFCRMTLLTNNTPVSLIDTEFWTMGGGPQPYHDSYTFSFYRKNADTSGLRRACYTACGKHDATIVAEIQGLSAPRISLWTRLRYWIS